jgi:hypothetical protein
MARSMFWLVLALWAMLYAASIAMFWVVEPKGDGLTGALNRVGNLALLQMIAAGVAVVVWRLGRTFSHGSALRWLARVPIALALLLVALLLALYVYGNSTRYAAQPEPGSQPDRPTTAPAEPVAPPP